MQSESAVAPLLVALMLLGGCATSSLDKAIQANSTDAALCSELPVDEAVGVTLEHAGETPTEVINAWALVVVGFDRGCEKER